MRGSGRKWKDVGDETVAYILSHLDDLPRKSVAEAAGVSYHVCKRIARAHGAWLEKGRNEITAEEAREVARLFPDMSGCEVARRLGCSEGRVYLIARRYGLRHSAAGEARLLTDKKERILRNAQKGAAKRVRTWKARRRLEEIRILSGMPREAHFLFRKMPRRHYMEWWRLTRVRGYISEGGAGDYTLLWDANTRRGDEELLARKYGFTFVEAGKEEENNGEENDEEQGGGRGEEQEGEDRA